MSGARKAGKSEHFVAKEAFLYHAGISVDVLVCMWPYNKQISKAYTENTDMSSPGTQKAALSCDVNRSHLLSMPEIHVENNGRFSGLEVGRSMDLAH